MSQWRIEAFAFWTYKSLKRKSKYRMKDDQKCNISQEAVKFVLEGFNG